MRHRCAIIALLAFVASSAPARGQTLYGISNGFGTPADNHIYQINPTTGATSNSVAVTLSGFTVNNALALAAQPSTGALFAVIQTSDGTNNARRLVTVNPTTGVATPVGTLARAFSSLAFRSDGVLWGVTGDGSTSDPETLFTLDTTTAAATLQFALGNGGDGETIAFHPNSLLYHSSGNGAALFESVNVSTQGVTPIGQAGTEMFAMGYHDGLGQLLCSDIASNLFSIDIATGIRTLIGNINSPNDNRGLAFVSAIPEPTLLGLMGAIGVATFARWRRSPTTR